MSVRNMMLLSKNRNFSTSCALCFTETWLCELMLCCSWVDSYSSGGLKAITNYKPTLFPLHRSLQNQQYNGQDKLQSFSQECMSTCMQRGQTERSKSETQEPNATSWSFFKASIAQALTCSSKAEQEDPVWFLYLFRFMFLFVKICLKSFLLA